MEEEKTKKEWYVKLLYDPRFWLIIIAIVLLPFGNRTVNKTQEVSEDSEVFQDKNIKKKYRVIVNIEFEGNWILNKYDVILKNSYKDETLTHGENKKVTLALKEGENKLTFVSADDSSIKNEVTLDVHTSMEVGYKIQCYSKSIDVKELYVDRDEKLSSNQIKIDFNNEDFTEKDYKDVIKRFQEAGFTNIVEKPSYDIVYNITPVGELKYVSIDGKKEFRRGDIFDKDTKVEVCYHMKDDDDPEKATPPYDYDKAEGKNYKEVEKDYKDRGFTNIVLKDKTTNTKDQEGKVISVKIDGNSPFKGDAYKKDVEVVINYYKYEEPAPAPEPSPEIKEKIQEIEYSDAKHQATAKRAFENMGKSLYPYGIKYHWIVGNRDFSYRGNGVWHIVVDVTITNEYNAKRDAVASGDVDFKEGKVKNFKVVNPY